MRTLFLLVILATSLTLNAQITERNWIVGGSGSFTSSTAISEDTSGREIQSKATGIALDPNIGYFLMDKFAVGLDMGIGFSNPPERNNSNWSLGIGPFVRYYFLKSENLINLFSEANFLYSTGLSKINGDRTSTRFGLSTGGVLFFNSSVGLELSLNYTDTTSKRDGLFDSEFKDFFVGLGFQIHLENR
ncbi:hypothetical protein [Salinimicrobium sp. HB62]|uniref:hypothetical protein n=1 Tax=Salinimicrobium sp. HB62 TaxID=3077781 RepID=UPI002D78C646|nr:hypothetical protein [Salinimicrobium sp. HB62]